MSNEANEAVVSELENMHAEHRKLRAEIERLTDENRKMNATLAKDAIELFETAAFLDGMADGPLDAVPIMMKNQDRRPNEEKIYDALRIAAADCRAMAAKLRGEP